MRSEAFNAQPEDFFDICQIVTRKNKDIVATELNPSLRLCNVIAHKLWDNHYISGKF